MVKKKVERAGKSKPGPVLLHKRLATIADCASKDMIRYALKGVQIVNQGDTVKLEVSDGKRLFQVYHKPADHKDFPSICGNKFKKIQKILIDADEFRRVLKNIKPNKLIPIVENASLSGGKDHSIITSTDLSMVSVNKLRAIEGNFPDTESVFPSGRPVTEVIVNAKLLIEMLSVIVKLQGKSKDNSVKLTLYEKKEAMRIDAKAQGDKIRALLMPLAMSNIR